MRARVAGGDEIAFFDKEGTYLGSRLVTFASPLGNGDTLVAPRAACVAVYSTKDFTEQNNSCGA